MSRTPMDTCEPSDQASASSILQSAQEDQASYLNMARTQSPSKADKSDSSSSSEKTFLTAPNSTASHNGSSSEAGESYISAAEQPEIAFSGAGHPWSSPELGDMSKGNDPQVPKSGSDEIFGQQASSPAGRLLELQEFEDRLLTFPEPDFQGNFASPKPGNESEERERTEITTAVPVVEKLGEGENVSENLFLPERRWKVRVREPT